MKTGVAEASTRPVWNATFLFGGILQDRLGEYRLRIRLFDFNPEKDEDDLIGLLPFPFPSSI